MFFKYSPFIFDPLNPTEQSTDYQIDTSIIIVIETNIEIANGIKMLSKNCFLKPVTKENWKKVIELSVSKDQMNLIGSNVRSLAEAYVRNTSVTFSIESPSGDIVGFMMYLTEEFDGKRHIHRFMIDEKHQRLGYGTSAMLSTINHIWYKEQYLDDIMIMFLTFNTQAESFYRKLGFEDTGDILGDEKLFRLPISLKEKYRTND